MLDYAWKYYSKVKAYQYTRVIATRTKRKAQGLTNQVLLPDEKRDSQSYAGLKLLSISNFVVIQSFAITFALERSEWPSSVEKIRSFMAAEKDIVLRTTMSNMYDSSLAAP
jgi:hypothetical protein